MNSRILRKALISSVVAITVLLAPSLLIRLKPTIVNDYKVGLTVPAFTNVANAADNSALTSFLDSEAGISAYFLAQNPINLNDVASLYRTIEISNSTHIIGSIAVQDYDETHDVHVYIHADGWVLAYYLKADPTSKVFDWLSYTAGDSIPTKLEKTLLVVAATIGSPSPAISFYHFQFPNANNMMLIAEAQIDGGEDSFQINPTGSFTYYERSWSLYSEPFGCSSAIFVRYYLDTVLIKSNPRCFGVGTVINQGALTAAQLLPNAMHTITVTQQADGNAYAGLALVYRVP